MSKPTVNQIERWIVKIYDCVGDAIEELEEEKEHRILPFRNTNCKRNHLKHVHTIIVRRINNLTKVKIAIEKYID